MRLLIDGVDYTDLYERSSIKLEKSLDDTIPKLTFDIYDVGSQYHFDALQRVVLLNQPDYSESTHNLLANPTFANSGSRWTASEVSSRIVFDGTIGKVTISFPGSDPSVVSVAQTTRSGFIKPNQTYCFSAYYATSAMVNAEADITYTITNADGSSSTTSLVAQTGNHTNSRVSATFTVGEQAAYITVTFALQNLPGSSSGSTFVVTHPQLEQVYSNLGITYPTTDCVSGGTNCTVLGNGTVVRQHRLFSGLLMTPQRSYSGSSSSRMWELEASGYGILIAKTLVTGAYTAYTDAQIAQNLISVYLPNDISTRNVISTGASFDQFSFEDVYIKDVLNTITKTTGAAYWVDDYADLHMQVNGYTNAPYNLSDDPDNMTTFLYQDLQVSPDASEMSNRIKIFGGSDSQKIQPAQTELFSGDGSNKLFTLGNQPRSITACSVGGTSKKVGIKGKDSFSNYDALINKATRVLEFNTAPASGTNNVSVTYTFNNPSAERLTDAEAVAKYGGYIFDSKIEDSALVTQADIHARGIIALQEYSTPRETIKLKTNQPFDVGDTVGITSRAESWSNKPYLIQKMTMTYPGVDEFLNEVHVYELELGAFTPTLTQHLLHLHKKLKHTSSHVSVAAEEHAVAIQKLTYSESSTPSTTITSGGSSTLVPLSLGLLKAYTSTLTGAGKMTSTVSSNSSVLGWTTHVGSATGWGELRASNASGTWQSLGAAGTPSDYCFLWDSTELEGHTLQSGNWGIQIRLGGSDHVMTADILFRAYKRGSGGTKTLIGSATLSSQTIHDDYVTYVFSPASMSSMAFVSGEKLYHAIWLNILTNANSSAGSVSIGAVATANPADSKTSWVTPGYI